MNEHILLTGFPSNEVARRVLERLVTARPSAHITCLVPERFMEQAEARLAKLPLFGRASLIEGDVAALDMGLSGKEYVELRRTVTVVHHCAAVTYSGAPTSMAQRVNVQGSCEIIEFARGAAHLDRIVHWSALGATWDRDGVVWEDELNEPHSSRLSHTRYQAERLIAKQRGELPIVILRPAMLAGDSRTGELSRIEGASLLIAGMLSSPRDVPVPRPGPGDVPLQIVPIDYAVDAGLALAHAKDAVGKTFQIVDPTPPSLDEALTVVAGIVGRPPPRGGLPPFARALVRMPLVEKLVHAQRALMDELGRDVLYDDRNARPILADAKLQCPRFESYAAKLVEHVRRERKSERPAPPPRA